MDCLSQIIFAYVFNQPHGHWLLNDALYFIILMNLNLNKENQIVPSFESLMEKIHLLLMSWFYWFLTLERKFVVCSIISFHFL
jgi:hypothetical protein